MTPIWWPTRTRMPATTNWSPTRRRLAIRTRPLQEAEARSPRRARRGAGRRGPVPARAAHNCDRSGSRTRIGAALACRARVPPMIRNLFQRNAKRRRDEDSVRLSTTVEGGCRRCRNLNHAARSRPHVSWPYPISNGPRPVLNSLTSASGQRTYGMTAKVLWDVVRNAAAAAGFNNLAPHDLRRTLLCAVPPLRRRTGPDPVPPRAHLDSDDRALPRVQAEASVRGERPPEHRA